MVKDFYLKPFYYKKMHLLLHCFLADYNETRVLEMDSNWPTVAFRTAENLPIDLARQIFGDADILELHNVGQMEKGLSIYQGIRAV